MWFRIDLRSQETINEQIKRGIKESILKGQINKDEMLPSIREMAEILQVNPNTVVRAYRELEAEGTIVARQGMGYLVVKGKEEIRSSTIESLQEQFRQPLTHLKRLGISLEEIQEVINSLWKKIK